MCPPFLSRPPAQEKKSVLETDQGLKRLTQAAGDVKEASDIARGWGGQQVIVDNCSGTSMSSNAIWISQQNISPSVSYMANTLGGR